MKRQFGPRYALWVVCLAGIVMPGMVGAQDAQPEPCTASEYSQFDFWIGKWEVKSPDGKVQGSNRIDKILGGCVLRESWNGSGGMTGHSYNIYSQASGGWHQTWVDNNGTLLLLDGGFHNGRMILGGELPRRDGGGMVRHEISWEPLESGQVRQVWRVSEDGGKTWKEIFAGIYTRTGE